MSCWSEAEPLNTLILLDFSFLYAATAPLESCKVPAGSPNLFLGNALIGFAMQGLGKLIRNISCLVNPVSLFFRLGVHFAQGISEACGKP